MTKKIGVRLFTDEIEQQMAEIYRNGGTLQDIADTFGGNPVTVRNALKRQGVASRRAGSPQKELSKDVVETICALWEEGAAVNKIALSCRIGSAKVKQVLAHNGYAVESRHPMAREGHHSWRGGRVIYGNGYVAVRPENTDDIAQVMLLSNGYVAEHRLVMAHYLNRPLYRWETVHHVDGDKNNNDIRNLQLRIGSHGKYQTYRCMDCGSERIEPVEL